MITQFDDTEENIAKLEGGANLDLFIDALTEKRIPIVVDGYTFKHFLMRRIITKELIDRIEQKPASINLENFIKQNYPAHLISSVPDAVIDITIKQDLPKIQTAIEQMYTGTSLQSAFSMGFPFSYATDVTARVWIFYSINNSGYYLCMPTSTQYLQHIKINQAMQHIDNNQLSDPTFITHLTVPQAGDDNTFVDTVLKNIMPSMDRKVEPRGDVEWYLLMSGYGGASGNEKNPYGRIAAFSLKNFSKLLLFFNSLQVIKAFCYSSCFSGGYHLSKPYTISNQNEYIDLDLNYTVISDTLFLESIIFSPKRAFSLPEIQIGRYLKQVINRWRQQSNEHIGVTSITIKPSLVQFFNQLQQYIDKGIGDLRAITQLITNPLSLSSQVVQSIPAIRFPHTQWFKLDKEYDDIQRITRIQTMRAFAENKSVTVTDKKYLFFDFYPQQKFDDKYWVYVPTIVNIEQNTMPIIWTNMPYDGVLYIKELNAPTVSFTSLLKSIINNPSKSSIEYYFEQAFCDARITPAIQASQLRHLKINKFYSRAREPLRFKCEFLAPDNKWYEADLSDPSLLNSEDVTQVVTSWLQKIQEKWLGVGLQQTVPPELMEQMKSMRSVAQAQKRKKIDYSSQQNKPLQYRYKKAQQPPF